MEKTNKENNSKKNYIILAIVTVLVAVIAVVAILVILNTNNQKPAGTVQFSTNPSVSMVVNDKDRVIEVQYLNSDAEILLSKTDFVGKNINEASKLFAQICCESGYIDATSSTGSKVEIIISNNDEDKVDSLGKKLSKTMNEYFDDNGIIAGATYLSLDQIKAQADALKISTNKYILIKTAQKMHVDYTEAELVEMSEQDILSAIKDKSAELKGVAQKYYEDYTAIAKDELEKFENLINNTISPILAQIKLIVPDFELNVSLDMSFGDLKKQITANITNETIKSTIEDTLDKMEKTFNDIKAEIKNEIKKLQDKIIEDSKNTLANAKAELKDRLTIHKQDVEDAKAYYKDHKDEIDAKIKAFRDSISVDVDVNFNVA